MECSTSPENKTKKNIVFVFVTFSSENPNWVQGSLHTHGPLLSRNEVRKLLSVRVNHT